MATFGASAPSSHTVNYDALLSTTLMNVRPLMVDNIFRSSAWLAALRQYGGVDYQDGGERIQRLLMYEVSGSVSTYSGYDQIRVVPQDGMTSAFFPWVELAGTITISRREERQNSGEARILGLLEQKIRQCEMTLKQEVNQQLVQGTVSSATFVPGTDGSTDATKMFPLGDFLCKDKTTAPVDGNQIGEINRATYSWWRPRVISLSDATDPGNSEDSYMDVSSWAGLKVGLHRAWNYCARGGDGSGPNIALADQVSYESYENALDQSKRYGDEKLVGMGFDNVRLKGATMIWDEIVPDIYTGTTAITEGTVFYVNTKFYKFVIDQQTDFVTTPWSFDRRSINPVNSGNIREDNPEPSPEAGEGATTISFESRAKRSEARGTLKSDDMVSSAWEHAAAMKMAA